MSSNSRQIRHILFLLLCILQTLTYKFISDHLCDFDSFIQQDDLNPSFPWFYFSGQVFFPGPFSFSAPVLCRKMKTYRVKKKKKKSIKRETNSDESDKQLFSVPTPLTGESYGKPRPAVGCSEQRCPLTRAPAETKSQMWNLTQTVDLFLWVELVQCLCGAWGTGCRRYFTNTNSMFVLVHLCASKFLELTPHAAFNGIHCNMRFISIPFPH